MIGPIIWWQVEGVERQTKEEKEVWQFSPFGASEVRGWILMRWYKMKRCNMGDWHTIQRWDGHTVSTMELLATNFKKPKAKEAETPKVPKDVLRELREKTKHIKKANAWEEG